MQSQRDVDVNCLLQLWLLSVLEASTGRVYKCDLTVSAVVGVKLCRREWSVNVIVSAVVTKMTVDTVDTAMRAVATVSGKFGWILWKWPRCDQVKEAALIAATAMHYSDKIRKRERGRDKESS